MSDFDINTGTDAFGNQKLPTGIENIDRVGDENLGGIPKGNLISVVSDPNSFGELVLDHLCYSPVEVVYFTNSRRKELIEDRLDLDMSFPGSSSVNKAENYTVIEIDNVKNTFEEVIDYIENNHNRKFNIIIESVSLYVLSKNLSAVSYLEKVSKIADFLKQKERIGYLYFVSESVSSLPDVDKEIMSISDGIIRVYTSGGQENNEKIDHLLTVNKMRRDDTIMEQPISLEVTDSHLEVDRTTDYV